MSAENRDPRESALSLLRRWHRESPRLRRDPDTIGSVEVERLGPMQLVLTSVYEARGVHYELQAAGSRPPVQDEGPDPWATALTHPEGLPVGSEATERLPDRRVHMDCGLCSGMGAMTCPSCGGTGQGGRNDQDGGLQPCGKCRGRGEVRCKQCEASGGLLGTPTLWSRIEQHEEIRVQDAPDLPLDVLSDLTDGDDGGEVEHVQEGPRVESLHRQGGYRDAGQAQDPLSRLAENLCQNPNVPSGARIHRQRLEVLQVPVFRVTSAKGETFWVYGDPPKVVPARALETFFPKVLRALPWLALAAVLGALAVFGWLTT